MAIYAYPACSSSQPTPRSLGAGLAAIVPALFAPVIRWVAIPIVVALFMVGIFGMFRRRRPKEPTELL